MIFQQHRRAGMCTQDCWRGPFLLYISCRVCEVSLAILWPGRRVFTIHHCHSSTLLSVLISVIGFIVTTKAACGKLTALSSRRWTVPVRGLDDPTAIPHHTSRDALTPRGGVPPILERSQTVESKRHRQPTRPFRFPGRQSARNRIYQATQLLPTRLPLSPITKRSIPGRRD
jgi:hypothetical protein